MRRSVILIVIFLSLQVAQARDNHWQTRFNHALGIQFELPPDFELMPSYDAAYSDGNDFVYFSWVDTPRLQDDTPLRRSCGMIALKFGYETEVIREDAPGLCKFTTDNADDTFMSVRPLADETTSMGEAYEYLAIFAPDSLLQPLAESVVFVDEIAPILYLDEALNMIEVNYIYRDEVKWENITQKAISLVNGSSTLDDVHQALEYLFEQLAITSGHEGNWMSPEVAREIWTNLTIGRGYYQYAATDADPPIVTFVYPDSPAARAGLSTGDIVEMLNGAPYDPEVDEQQRGEPVTLGVRRKGQQLTIKITPGEYSTYLPITTRKIDDNIGYIETFTFESGYDEPRKQYPTEAHQLIAELDQQGVCGWIIDTRRNYGGDAGAMSAALGPLLAEGRWYGFEDIYGATTWYDYNNGGFGDIDPIATVDAPYHIQQPDAPMAVLVSADTSSMGELTAYLIQHRPEGITRLFGEPTYGVMSDATVYLPLFDGSLMQIVDTRIVNPDGVQLPERVEPDVPMTVDYTRYGGDDDLLIQAAHEWLMEQPACG